jgi:ABC transport system ATP-binding/permease protein
MSALISCNKISKTYTEKPLFENVSINVCEGDRIGMIGANASGKTTLLRIMAGLAIPDAGKRVVRNGLRIGYVPQQSIFAGESSVLYEALDAARQACPGNAEDETDLQVRVATVLRKLGFSDLEQMVSTLSGGWRKRLDLAGALVGDPEVLLLDEPTNHLDLEGVLWLEKLLIDSRLTYVVVSHDRSFLQKIAKRTLELDRRYSDGIFSVEGDYSTFLEKREELLIARDKQEQSLNLKVRKEVAWLRSGVKARTTKAKARIDEAHNLIEELGTMKSRGATGRAGIDFSATGRKTKRLLTAVSVGKSMGDKRLFGDFNLLLRPKMRLGLVGGNGSGKTTLLRMLAGELEPDEGQIERAEKLRTVYYDQQREQLDTELTLQQALAEHGDMVIYQERPIHVAAWAARFRFRAEQLSMRVGKMSGGERAKILIARLMLLPADILLLDEPTNDLDIPTLEVLEESLNDFPGAIVIVTHDRYMLDRISTVLVGLDGKGGTEYYAEYEQWENLYNNNKQQASVKKQGQSGKGKPKAKPMKLSYKESREYEGMEAAIEQAEFELDQARREMEDPGIASDHVQLLERIEVHQEAQNKLDVLYERWYELEQKREDFQGKT